LAPAHDDIPREHPEQAWFFPRKIGFTAETIPPAAILL
jgi:hypothetical protein